MRHGRRATAFERTSGSPATGGARRPRRSGDSRSPWRSSPGLTSLGYQTLWTRLLSSGTGSVSYVFSAILVFFLIGLALGPFIVATRHAPRDPDAARGSVRRSS